jgi:hypothetical protein
MTDLALTGTALDVPLEKFSICVLCKEPLGQEGSTSCEAYNATPSAQDSVHVLILTHDRGNPSLCV